MRTNNTNYIEAFTDYPIIELGDIKGKRAPIRTCLVTDWDGDNYCMVLVPYINGRNLLTEIKKDYLYKVFGRSGEVPCLTIKDLERLL